MPAPGERSRRGLREKGEVDQLAVVRTADTQQIALLRQSLHRGGDVGFGQPPDLHNVLGCVQPGVVGEKQKDVQLDLSHPIAGQNGALQLVIEQLQRSGVGKIVPGHSTASLFCDKSSRGASVRGRYLSVAG